MNLLFMGFILLCALGIVQVAKISQLEKRVDELTKESDRMTKESDRLLSLYNHLREKQRDIVNDMDGYADEHASRLDTLEAMREDVLEGFAECGRRISKLEADDAENET